MTPANQIRSEILSVRLQRELSEAPGLQSEGFRSHSRHRRLGHDESFDFPAANWLLTRALLSTFELPKPRQETLTVL